VQFSEQIDENGQLRVIIGSKPYLTQQTDGKEARNVLHV